MINKNILNLNFKALTEIKDEKERFNVIQSIYCCDISKCYYDEKYSGYRDYLIFKTKDNYYLIFENKKPTISRTMYYDDETEGPSNDLESFKQYNMFYNFRAILWDKRANQLNKPDYAKIENFLELGTLGDCHEFGGWRAHNIRMLTEDEKDDLMLIDQIRKAEFEKRLNTYFRKYKDRIHSCGYWANR